jgi:ABC-2 type transport system ATP-binding protein
MDTAPPAVLAEGLSKRYGKTVALDGFDLRVPRGAVCGLLGPNGAGKTTAIRILATLVRPDGGRAAVDGLDVVRQAPEVRTRIGLVGQNAALDEVLSGRQNLVMFGRLFHLRSSEAGRRADELLERFGLSDAGNKPVKQYSGGMRRRLDLAASLILAPAVLFLDEPTTGLDPRGRNEVWDGIRALVRDGTTVLLTTQYLDEADQLSDQICVIDLGRVIASGSPTELKMSLGSDRMDLVLRNTADLDRTAELIARVVGSEADIDADNRRLSAPVENRVSTLTEVLRAIEAAGIDAEDVALRRPTLDEVFLHLTGRRPTDDETPTDGTTPAAAEKEEVAA